MVTLFDYCKDCDAKDERIAELEAALLRLTEAPSSGSATSRDAAEQVKVSLTPQRERLLNALRHSRASAEMLADRTGLTGNSVRPRLRECQTVGWVRCTTDTVQTKAGRSAFLYELTDAGRALIGSPLVR
jgi:hypothetical protein